MDTVQRNEYIMKARAKGAEVGKYVASMGWVKANQTIGRAAVGYVNRLPLNDIKFEAQLEQEFIIGAEIAVNEISATHN